MSEPQVLDIAGEIDALAEHFPRLTIILVRQLGHTHIVDPDSSTIWIEDTAVDDLPDRITRAVKDLAEYHGIDLRWSPPQLWLVPTLRFGT